LKKGIIKKKKKKNVNKPCMEITLTPKKTKKRANLNNKEVYWVRGLLYIKTESLNRMNCLVKMMK